MKMHKVLSNEVEDAAKLFRASLGGYPILIEGQEWPRCRICDELQVLFFQFDIEERFELPFKPGSHLSMVICINHDEPTNPPLWPQTTGRLAENYWDCGEEESVGHFKLIKNPPNSAEKVLEYGRNGNGY